MLELERSCDAALASLAPGRSPGPSTRRRGRDAPPQPPYGVAAKQRRFFQRPVNANAPQDYTPFAAPPPPRSARPPEGSVHGLLARAAPGHGLGLLAAPRFEFSADERAATTAAVSVRSRKCRVEKRLAEAERSAVKMSATRQRASEDAERKMR